MIGFILSEGMRTQHWQNKKSAEKFGGGAGFFEGVGSIKWGRGNLCNFF